MKREDIEAAIIAAHQAGDEASATTLAGMLTQAPAATGKAEIPGTPPQPTPEPDKPIPTMLPASGKRKSSPDRTGFIEGNLNEGIARILGLPVDTAQNVLDLGKAGIGTAIGAVTGRAPPSAFDPADRSQIPLSGAAISNNFRGTGIIDPAATDPTGTGGQLAAGALQAVPSVLAGGRVSPGSAVKQAGGAALSGATAAAAGITGADPATQIVAGMLPSMAPHAAVSAKNALRDRIVGGADVKGRISEAQRAGIPNPSAAAVTGSRPLGMVEGTVARLPGAGSTMDAAAEARAKGMQGRVGEIVRDLAGGSVSTERAGRAVEAGVAGAVEQFRSTQKRLYDKVDEVVDPQQPIRLDRFRAALRKFANPTPGAEATSRQLVPPKVAALFDAVETDLAAVRAKPKTDPNAPVPAELEPMPKTPQTPDEVGAYLQAIRARKEAIDKQRAARDKAVAAEENAPPQQADNTITRRRDASIEKIERQTPIEQPFAEEGRAATDSLPYQTVSGVRSQLGRLLEDGMLLTDAPKGMYRALYRALSDDVRDSLPPQAKQAWERASKYTKAGHDRIDNVYQPLVDQQTPERALKAAMSGTREGASGFRKIMGALTPDQRNAVAAHVIENMGKAPAHQQNETGDRFSVESFLTNYNKLDSGARKALFPSPSTQKDIETIASAASRMREAGRGTYNPAGTARAVTHAGFAGAGMYTVMNHVIGGAPGAALGAAGGLAAEAAMNHMIARAITSPEFLHWLAEGSKAPAADVPRYAARLNTIAQNTRDPETKQALSDIAQQLTTAGQ